MSLVNYDKSSLILKEMKIKSNRDGPDLGFIDCERYARGDLPILVEARGDPKIMFGVRGDPSVIINNKDGPSIRWLIFTVLVGFVRPKWEWYVIYL